MHAERNTGERSDKETTLAALYDEYYDKIARYIFVRIGDQAQAEDLVGETFLKALQSLDSYQERGIPMHSWLFRIAHNLVVDYLRQAAKRKTVPIDTVQVVSQEDPQATAETNSELARVAKALEQLTPAQRRVIELRFFGELTSEEVGKALNKSNGAVREMQSAAIRRLRELLREES